MKEPLIIFRNVRKAYGENVLFDNFNFEVYPHEIVALIGPSGSGKSTLARMVIALEEINGGSIEIDGEPLWPSEENGLKGSALEKHLKGMRKKCGMVFQHFNLFPHMTVLRNIIEAPVHALKLKRDEALKRALDLLRLVGLEDKVEAYPSELSGGQKQRVAIARALAMQPEILLLDEITSALDPELVDEVLDVIRSLAREHRHTMIIVTHEMYFAEEIADRICFMDKGRIIEEGRPDVLFYEPKKERTRDFLKSYIRDKK